MKAKILGKALTLLAALALFANTSVWGAGSASPTSVMVPVGGSVEVTITNNDSNNRTLRIGSTGSTALGTWSNDSLSATLSSTSVSSGRTTTLTITGLKANDSSQTISIYRTGNTTEWCTITVSKVVVPIEKTVAVGDTLTFNSTAQVTSRYYYQFASADTSSVTATPNGTNTRNGYGAANVSLSVTGVKATTSPVLVTLQQRSGTSGDFAPVEFYSVTVTKKVDAKTSTAPEMTTLDGAGDFQLPQAFSGSCRWTVSSTSGNSATATVKNSTTSTAQPTLTITPQTAGTTTFTVRNSNNTDSFDFTWTVTVTVKALQRELRTATVGANGQLTVSASDLDGTIASVRSDDTSIATVALAGGVATITGVKVGSTTVRIRTATTEYAYTVTVTPPTICLCVGDVVKFNYDFGGTGSGSGSLLRVQTSGSAVEATAATQGANASTGGTRYYRSGYLQITANDVGTQSVTLQRRVRGQSNYVDYDTVNVVVLPARTILKGETTNDVCKASLM